jgi:hypothetical protein
VIAQTTTPWIGSIAVPLIVALLGGGMVQGIIGLLRLRIDKKKAPVEKDSIIVGGAEKAVLSLQAALVHAEKEMEHLRQAHIEDQKRIAECEATIHTLEVKVETLEGIIERRKEPRK